MKPRRKMLTWLTWTVAGVAVVWTGLTIWVEMEGPARWTQLGSSSDSLKVLVLYDPDPIYNLDEQICNSIGKGIAEEKVEVVVATVSATKKEHLVKNFDAVVLCANTYNWAPDWAITGFVKSNPELKTIPIFAVTIGSGSTGASHHRLNKLLSSCNLNVVDEHQWWLMRPNDEARMKEPNVNVANDEAFAFGKSISEGLKKSGLTSISY